MLKRTSILLLALTTAMGATAVFAQTSEPTGDALVRALLQELRALRVTLQKNSAHELRGRLLIDRARLHQETIRELSREVEASTDFMRNEPVDVTYDMEMEMESRMAGVPNPEERKRMIAQQKQAMEKRKEMEQRHREQMRMRFQRVENRLAEEREKLRVIEEELAEIQRELTVATP